LAADLESPGLAPAYKIHGRIIAGRRKGRNYRAGTTIIGQWFQTQMAELAPDVYAQRCVVIVARLG